MIKPQTLTLNPRPYLRRIRTRSTAPEIQSPKLSIHDYYPSTLTRPAPLSFRENKDLEANQTGSHTNAVGRNVYIHTFDRLQNATAGKKVEQSFRTKETVPQHPYSLKKTGARKE
jgi:hypothetical protein